MTLRQFVAIGDSLVGGTVTDADTASGGLGSWVEQFAEPLANLLKVPVVSPGLRGLWSSAAFLAGGDDQWAKTGTWAKTASTDVFDRGPYGYAFRATGGLGKYRVDGGSFVAFPTVTADNLVHRFYVATPVTNTVELATNDGVNVVTWTKPAAWRAVVGFSVDYIAVAAATCIIGIVPYFIAPQGLNAGVIVHNLGVNGNRLDFLTAATSGDRMAWLDSVVLDAAGAPIANTPNAGTLLLHINDVAIGSSSAWGADLATYHARVGPLGPVVFLNPWECSTGTYNQAQQTAYRAQTKTSAGTLGATVLDFYDEYAAKGIVGNTATQAAGLLSDAVHQTQDGHTDQGLRVYWLLRELLFDVGPANAVLQVGASAAGGTDHLGGAPAYIDTGGLAVEVDTALAGTVAVGIVVEGALAVEVDEAFAGTVLAGGTVFGHQALEVDEALPGTVVVHLVINGDLAVEVDTALAGTHRFTAGTRNLQWSAGPPTLGAPSAGAARSRWAEHPARVG